MQNIPVGAVTEQYYAGDQQGQKHHLSYIQRKRNTQHSFNTPEEKNHKENLQRSQIGLAEGVLFYDQEGEITKGYKDCDDDESEQTDAEFPDKMLLPGASENSQDE